MDKIKASLLTFWRSYWWAVVICLVSLFFYLLPLNLETRVRWAGIIFELVGIGVVAWGLSDMSAFFGGRSFPKWLGSFFVKEPPRHIFLEAEGASYAFSGAAARVAVTGLTPEQKVAQLEERCDGLEDEVEVLRKADKKLKGEFEQSIADEGKARRAGDKQLEHQLKQSMVGTLSLDVTGLMFLVLGVFLANGSQDFAALFGALGVK